MGADELFLRLVLMDTDMELLEPYIASHMVIGDRFALFRRFFGLSHGYPLLDDSAVQNHRAVHSAISVILKLRDAEKSGVGHLEPTVWLHDTEVVSTCTT